jgi:hypothetical protein
MSGCTHLLRENHEARRGQLVAHIEVCTDCDVVTQIIWPDGEVQQLPKMAEFRAKLLSYGPREQEARA